MHALVAHYRRIMDKNKVPGTIGHRTDHATVKQFIRSDGNVNVGYEQEEPKGLKEGVSAKVFGASFDTGE